MHYVMRAVNGVVYFLYLIDKIGKYHRKILKGSWLFTNYVYIGGYIFHSYLNFIVLEFISDIFYVWQKNSFLDLQLIFVFNKFKKKIIIRVKKH